jgi:jumonji domain-containing protein 7
MSRWTRGYLIASLPHPVMVAQTPTGRADAVHDGAFLLPHLASLPMPEALAALDASLQSPHPAAIISYIQSQDDNMHGDFAPLLADVPAEVAFVSEALGRPPDAVNFWMGNEASTTSLHKDPYENVLVVVQGCKVLTLLPPTDLPWLYERAYPTLQQSPAGQGGPWDPPRPLQPPLTTSWIPVDPEQPDLQVHPLYARAHPVQVRVEAGDMLYLPSLWYHHVRQLRGDPTGVNACISCNWWYDMEYGAPFHQHHFLRDVCQALDLAGASGGERGASVSRPP